MSDFNELKAKESKNENKSVFGSANDQNVEYSLKNNYQFLLLIIF